MTGHEVEELTTTAELREVHPIMHQLRPVAEEAYLEVLEEMRAESGYRLFALRDDADADGDGDHGPIRALAGVVVDTNLYHGKHAWVHDLVVDEPHRGQGYGGALLSWVESWADERDCSCVELASGLWREEAHRFYERAGWEKYCYTFKKDLSAESMY